MSRRRSKYGAVRTEVAGVSFASKAEARRFRVLRLLEQAGHIRDLEVQPSFPIEVVNPRNGEVILCGKYLADFRFWDVASNRVVVEDVKSAPTKTAVYRLKKRLTEARYGIEILETA